MSVEILTVSLSDESIERVAAAVAARLSGKTDQNTRRTQSDQVSSEGSNPPDPWAGPTGQSGAAPAATGSAPGAGSSAAAPQGEGKTVKTKDGTQFWTFPPNAPNCQCGQPAGRVSATSARTGKQYKAFRCAKRAGDDWRSACEFNEFTR